jgi:hypothetical protein
MPSRCLSGRPLKTENITVRILKRQLFHSVGSDRWWQDRDSLCTEFRVRGIDVRATEVDTGVVVGSGSRGIGRNGTLLIRFVSGVEHELSFSQAEETPVKTVLPSERRRGRDDSEAELVPIEMDRGRHVIDLNQRNNTA